MERWGGVEEGLGRETEEGLRRGGVEGRCKGGGGEGWREGVTVWHTHQATAISRFLLHLNTRAEREAGEHECPTCGRIQPLTHPITHANNHQYSLCIRLNKTCRSW